MILCLFQLCVHPAGKIRKALVDGIGGLLSNCRCTLERSKIMLLVSIFFLLIQFFYAICCAGEDNT